MDNDKSFRKFVGAVLPGILKHTRGTAVQELKIEEENSHIAFKRTARGPAPSRAPKVRTAGHSAGKIIAITSGLVGFFHRAATPFETPLVEKGQEVTDGQVIGYVESMRLMHEIRSLASGIITDILVEENGSVEYGTALMQVRDNEGRSRE
ncbi:MAG: acetyl-CoA carboxylase biotin carboxyl carrier protein subunit [Candidatus Eremiobacteraeota bacterium]|nr:acetyl-CoA carboxylase biotin carboxyl carrier protein subunit [Candidatus Eremiobacteraeota bacterium]